MHVTVRTTPDRTTTFSLDWCHYSQAFMITRDMLGVREKWKVKAKNEQQAKKIFMEAFEAYCADIKAELDNFGRR